MKKLIVGIAAIVAMVSAVDLDGKIGMGLGWAPDGEEIVTGIEFPVVDIAVTRYGLSPTMAIEPIIQFTMYNESDGASETDTDIKFAGLLNFLVKGHNKTNIYGKGGLGFGISSVEGGETEIVFELPFGFGLEHFCSEHFSINLAALSGFRYVSNPDNVSGSTIQIKLGNDKPFAFYLLWYY